MADVRRIHDRAPRILAAGLVMRSQDTVSTCLKHYSTDDAVSSLKTVAGKTDPRPEFRQPPWTNSLRRGVYTDIQPILQPPVSTRYQTVVNELKETSYDSHWNKVVGRGRDPVPGLPIGMKAEETSFGVAHDNGEATMKELVSPDKSHLQVMEESQVGHDMYKKTHNDYDPSERIDRNYLKPPFDSTKKYGRPDHYDPLGTWMRPACQLPHLTAKEPLTVVNEIQADFVDRHKPKLGKVHEPNRILQEVVPQDFVFGVATNARPLYDMEELLRDGSCPPCQAKFDFMSWMASFNKLRLFLNKNFDLRRLQKKLLYHDRGHNGVVQLADFYDVCSRNGVDFNKSHLEPLLRALAIIRADDGTIHYEKFIAAIDYNNRMQLPKINDVPEDHDYFLTTNQASTCDHMFIDNSKSPIAGVPSIRNDLQRPIVPPGGCRADLDNLGDETSTGNLISPSIFANYGLSFRDFFIPREKQTIRGLFERVGYSLGDESFEKLWKVGIDNDKTGLVCVDTFYMLLKTHHPMQKNLTVDEAVC